MESRPSNGWSLLGVGVVIGLVWGALLALLVFSFAGRAAPATATMRPAGAQPVAPQPVAAVSGARPVRR